MIAAPTQLRTNDEVHPLGIEGHPRLSWQPISGARTAEVVVTEETGNIVWETRAATTVPEVRANVPLQARQTYQWKARVASADGGWGPWSRSATFETGVPSEAWTAAWVARPVPAHTRTQRSLNRDRVDWAESGERLSQQFTAAGPVVSVNLDLVGDLNVPVRFDMELTAASGTVIAARTVDGPQHIWERFLHYIEIDNPPVNSSDYTISVHVHEGRVGWYTGAPATDIADDGVSPLQVAGQAFTGEERVDGVRSIGIETIPAANPEFRHVFTLSGEVRKARLRAVALGNGRFTLNGNLVGDGVLDPGPTDYDKTVSYRTWDVTHLLQRGSNELRIEAGRGTFAARGASIWGWNLAPWHAEPTVRSELEVLLHTGERVFLISGPDWEARESDMISDLYYSGETSISRLQPTAWEQAKVVPGPSGRMRAADFPPIRELAVIEPVAVTQTGAERFLYDFGTTLTGKVQAEITGIAGSSVSVQYGEATDTEGRVISYNQFTVGPTQLDIHRFERAATIATWQPRFGYRGFRWVEIETQGTAEVANVLAVRLHTDVPPTGEFDTDEPVLRWLDPALRNTFLNNLHGVPTDTPIYEKNGWTADAHLAAQAVLQQLDLRRTLGKWVQDHADAQDANGVVPQIVPTPGWARPADPAWSASTVLIPWYLYWEYGDPHILDNAVSMITRYADALLEIADGQVWPIRSWGDWLPPGYSTAPEGAAPTATMMMRSVLQHTAMVLTHLGRDRESVHYQAAADRISDAYHAAYFDPGRAHYRVPGVEYRQTMNVLPLAFGAVPHEQRDGVAQSLIADIQARTNGHLDTGAVGTPHLLPVLSKHGRDDLALTIATTRTRPGWGAWFEAGETTLLEAWDISARSRNHYFLGGAAAWAHQRVGGIRATAPGWEEILIDPINDPRVNRGSLTHQTVRGTVRMAWMRRTDYIDVDVTVPVGACARVTDSRDQILGEGRHRVIISI